MYIEANVLVGNVQKHYFQSLKHQALRVLRFPLNLFFRKPFSNFSFSMQIFFSSDTLGSPVHFFTGVKTGVYDFFHEPLKV